VYLYCSRLLDGAENSPILHTGIIYQVALLECWPGDVKGKVQV
jgi:hypothetical protein